MEANGKKMSAVGADCVCEQILYMIFPKPYKAWYEFGQRKIPYLLDKNMNPVRERWPDPDQPVRRLRFFPLLHGIDVVSSSLFSLDHHLLFSLNLPPIDWYPRTPSFPARPSPLRPCNPLE